MTRIPAAAVTGPPGMDYGCFDCPADGAPLMDLLVTLLLVMPLLVFAVWLGWGLVSRLKDRK